MMNYSDKKWYVFYTYPKFEKKLHECLIKENYDVLLPMHWIVRQWSDRKKKLNVPMFPNYIFVNVEYNRIFDILKNPKVISTVKFNNKSAFLRQKEIEYLKNIAEANYSVKVSQGLKVGDPIMIAGGPLCGLEGVLVEERGNHRFAVQIKSLLQSILIDVPSCYVESLELATY